MTAWLADPDIDMSERTYQRAGSARGAAPWYFKVDTANGGGSRSLESQEWLTTVAAYDASLMDVVSNVLLPIGA